MASTPHMMIAPDDSDFIDSEDEMARSEDRQIEQVLLSETPRTSPTKNGVAKKLWPCNPLIRVHKRLWFTWFTDPTPSEEELNADDGKQAAWTKWDNTNVDDAEKEVERLHWFTVDQDLVYLSFWFDWGPLNVAMFYRFCLHVHHLLTDPEMQDCTLVLYTSNQPAQKANAALLVSLYAMIIGKVAPADAFFPISELEFKPFRDAGYGRPDFDLSIQDILYGIHRAINEELLDLTTFNLDEYEKYEQVQHGDWNWITPNFIAFASPNDREYTEALRLHNGVIPASQTFIPKAHSAFANTIRYFKQRSVKLVVRLNNALYDKTAFEQAGIQHVDMYFDDGSNPSEEILRDFIARADAVIADKGVVAVHCKAGLGRTGVLIGAYLVWRYGFTAGEVIGFMRIMRPGCVVGPQQHFIYQNFVEWVKWGVRDSAIKEARLLATSKPAVRSSRTSLKRRAQDSDGDESDREPTQKAEPILTPGPQTPKPKRARDDGAVAAVPMAKPTPCVGQPRKSPSPSRKRPAIQAPATVARMEGAGRSYPTASLRSFDAAHATGMLMLQTATRPAETGRHTPDSPSSVSDTDSAEQVQLGLSSAGGAGVLVESRVNIVVKCSPQQSPKANMTPSLLRVRKDVSPTLVRASPTVRDRYQLRDTSKSPPPSTSKAVSSDAHVLGVMECIPQSDRRESPQAKVRVAGTSPVARTYFTPKDENNTPNVLATSKVVKAPLTAAVVVPPPGPRVLSTTARAKTPTPAVARRPTVPTVPRTTSAVTQVRSTVLRTQKSAVELRTAARPTVARVGAVVRSVSGTSNCATVTGNAAAQPPPPMPRPKSRLTAPTAASAARAAVSVKRPATVTTSQRRA